VVRVQRVTHVLRVPIIGAAGETDQVSEEH